jgi:uncharacterized protein YwgA
MIRHSPERTELEQLTDQFLLLYLVDDAKVGLGNIKLQKIAYLSELEMNSQGTKGLNYNFIKKQFGPYSLELKTDVNKLVNANVITDTIHQSTDFGKSILKNFQNIIDDNCEIMIDIQNANSNKNLRKDVLVETVHEMHNPLKPEQTIDETQYDYYILKRMKKWQKEKAFRISKSDVASLEIYFDFKTYYSLTMSLAVAKTTPAIKLRDVV